MANYKVVFEIEVDETSPINAAATVEEWLQDTSKTWQYYVQGEDGQVNSVDLSEEPEDAVLPAVDYKPLIEDSTKIVVNKSATETRRKQVLGEILASARDAAERGVDSFMYQFVTGERASWSGNIHKQVEEASEGTVKCAYRGDHDTYTKYIIIKP